MLRLVGIKIRINKAVDLETEKQALRNKILSSLRINERELLGFTIFKKSIDARKKNKIFYVYTVDVEVHNEE